MHVFAGILMTPTELNNPVCRQSILRTRVAQGISLVARSLAQEFEVSQDTIRRDLLALEGDGTVQRVRGGAIPVRKPASPITQRSSAPDPILDLLARAALPLIADGMVILLDGGTTIGQLAKILPTMPNSLIVTPSPMVALETLRAGTKTLLIGGRLSAYGGVSVGTAAEQAIDEIAADICFLGACGLDAEFGLSSDDLDESTLKKRMATAAHQCLVLCTEEKLGQRARHKTLDCREIDRIITHTDLADPAKTRAFANLGITVENV